MNGGLPLTFIVRPPQFFAINRDHRAFGHNFNRLHLVQKTLFKLLRLNPGKDPVKGIVAWNAMLQP